MSSTVCTIATNVDSAALILAVFVYGILSVTRAALESLAFQEFLPFLHESLLFLETSEILHISDMLEALEVHDAFGVLALLGAFGVPPPLEASVIFEASGILGSFGTLRDLGTDAETDDWLCYCSCCSA